MGQAREQDCASAAAEQRAAQRYALMLRAGKLVCDGQEFLCILRDASATGFKARLFHNLPKGAAYELQGRALAAGRMVGDIDLMVPAEQLAHAEAMLKAQGWRADAMDAYDEH